ncbi:MAG: hypothetical protein QOJ65_274, partial [Fimbriimonadaceae bacterium]|nr:hypothetical protein [Fimbriimonadaceae bacterium]
IELKDIHLYYSGTDIVVDIKGRSWARIPFAKFGRMHYLALNGSGLSVNNS